MKQLRIDSSEGMIHWLVIPGLREKKVVALLLRSWNFNIMVGFY